MTILFVVHIFALMYVYDLFKRQLPSCHDAQDADVYNTTFRGRIEK